VTAAVERDAGVIDDHFGALRGHQERNAASDSAAGPGYDGDFAL
jgi:hypothetical protein